MTASYILFHVGLHKTGTSSLQHLFFQPKNGFMQHAKRVSWWLPFLVDKFSTELVDLDAQSQITEFIKSCHDNGLVPVASHERFSGYPYSGGYDRLSIYRRIAALDNPVKILFIMREQKSWLYSAWKQMIKDGGAVPLARFLDNRPRVTNVRMPQARFAYVNYALEIKTLHSIFGRENVCVLPMELLTQDFALFCKILCDFLGLDHARINASSMSRKNESGTLSDLYFRYAVNRVLVSSLTSPRGLIADRHLIGRYIRGRTDYLGKILPEIPWAKSIEKKHKSLIKDTVGDYFAKSNKEAAALLNLDLRQYGYDLGGNS